MAAADGLDRSDEALRSTCTTCRPLVGQEIGVSDWITVDQQRIDLFAEATGDHQWIHVDPERAAAGPFGTTIAHGFLTLSCCRRCSTPRFDIDDVRMGVNYGLNRVRFTGAGARGQPVRGHFSCWPTSRIEGGAQLTVEVTIELRRLGQAGLRGRVAVAPLRLSRPKGVGTRRAGSHAGRRGAGDDDESAAGR